MKRMAFKKIFLPVVIFVFSVLVLGQPGWACDEPAPECSVQLDIKWVEVDLYNSLIYIWGEHFDNGPIKPPDVTLAGYPLVVNSSLSNAEWIVAALLRVPEDIAYGQYRLRVSTGRGQKCKDKYSVKIHPAPPKPSCEPCPGTCTCPEVEFVTETVYTKEFSAETINGIATGNFKGTASCTEGYRVTGGGFSFPDGLGVKVIETRPSAFGTGWELVVAGGIDQTPPWQPPSELTVWAVCGKVQQKVQ